MQKTIDVTAILQQWGIVVRLEKRGWLNIRCPFCSDSGNNGGFHVAAGGYYSCWRCGAHGLPDVFSALFRISISDALRLVEDNSGRQSVLAKLNQKAPASVRPKTVAMPGDEMTSTHRRYLKKRQFDPSVLEARYDLRGTGIAGEWKYRIMIPIYLEGRLVTFQGRDTTGLQKAKYKTLEPEKSVIPIDRLLYNLDHCLDRRVVLVEGVADVWRLGDGVAATFGTSMTQAKLMVLSERFPEVVFLFDPELEAQKRARDYAGQLSARGVAVELALTDYERDPGDLLPEQVAEVRAELGLPLGGQYRV